MKKIFLFAIIASLSMSAMSQSMKEIEKMVVLQKFDQAKTLIDQFLAVPANAEKADGWYYKGRIYNVLGNDTSLSSAAKFNMKEQAFDAFKKYQDLDQKQELLDDEKHHSFLELYAAFYDIGAARYNTQDPAGSHQAFKKALEVEELIVKNNYKYSEIEFGAFDTTLVMNVAVTADQAKNRAAAIPYFKMIADRGIGGASNQQSYEIVIDYLTKQGDTTQAVAYIDKARKVYPTNALWDDLEVKLSSGNQSVMFAKYEDLIAKNPKSFPLAYNYAVEIYNSLYGSKGEAPKDEMAAKNKLTEILNIAVANDEGHDAQSLLTNHLYNVFADYNQEYNKLGTAAANAKKKAEVKKLMDAAGDAAIVPAKAVIKAVEAMPEITNREKAQKKTIYGFLVDIYSIKGDAKTSADYEALRKAVVMQ